MERKIETNSLDSDLQENAIKEWEELPRWKKIVWPNVLIFIFGHVLYVVGSYHVLTFNYDYRTMLFAIVVGMLAGEGVTMGAHRLWAHKCFKAVNGIKLILLIAQTLAGQNCLYIWARDHRLHHKYSDTNADPHNSNRGFFFSHVGWLMMKKHPDVLLKGKDLNMSDLEADPFVMFQKRHYKKLYFLISVLIPTLVPRYFWGETWLMSILLGYVLRYLTVLHFTWCVNSVAHMYGNRPYTRNIPPRESLFVSVVALGEGWHNYHHTFPWDYRASELGMSFNLTTRLLDIFAKFGWVYNLKFATENMVMSRITNHGDGTHIPPPKNSNNSILEFTELAWNKIKDNISTI